VNPESDARYRDYWGSYHELMARRGVTPEVARTTIRTNTHRHRRGDGPSG
jgi:malate dehydrogenase (oxaloacetate-decarboxylating)(NADP+)